MSNQQDQQKIDAHKNQQTVSKFAELDTNKMLQGTSGRFFDKRPNQQTKPKQDQELLCACGGKCEGICREQHLYRERTANPTAKAKGAVGIKSWTNPPNQCPESYTL